jgi:hypothetical protein
MLSAFVLKLYAGQRGVVIIAAANIPARPSKSASAVFNRLNSHPLMQTTSAAFRADLAACQDVEAGEEPIETISRLGPWKSSVENPSLDTFERRFRFRNFASERSLWLAALPQVETDHRKLDRFQNCGSRTWVKLDEETGHYVFTSETCKLRICPACRQRIQRAGSDRIAAMLTGFQKGQWQLITLTLRHSRQPLPDQLDFLKRSFRKLRQRRFWTDAVHHGYAVLEIARNAETDEWHPHLHVLARTNYIDWKQLRNAWRAVTIGSDQIDCQLVKTPIGASNYIAKYLGKPPDNSMFLKPHRVGEYYQALQSSRLMIPFGKPPKPQPDPLPKTKPKLRLLGSLDDIRAAALAGNGELADHWPKILLQARFESDYYANIRDGIPAGPRSPPPREAEHPSRTESPQPAATATTQRPAKQLRIW